MSWSALIVALAVAQAEVTSLSAKQQSDVQAACAAFQQGAPLTVVQRLSSLVSKDEVQRDVEEELKRRQLPPLGEVLAAARLALVQQGQAGQVPRPTRNEVLLLLPAVKQRLHAMLDEISGRAVLRDTLPPTETFAMFADVLWQLDAVESQLDDIEQVGGYLRTLARGLAKADLDKLDGELRAMVQNDDAGSLVASFDAIRGGLEERRVELAIGRLRLAAKILSQPQLTVDHLLAATVWSGDFQRASAFLKKPRRTVRRAALREHDLTKSVTTLGEQLKKSSGPLSAKARLLQEGLDWWLRARYGAGPDAMGLVKGQEQVRTPDGRFELYLPNEFPRPHDPFIKPEPDARARAQYERRHLYAWACGSRGLHGAGCVYAGFQTDKNLGKRPGLDPADASYHRRKLVANTIVANTALADDRGPTVIRTAYDSESETLLRLVGFLEYAQALSRFDQLLSTASLNELAAMDELVKSQDQYMVYVNLSRAFPQTATTGFPERNQLVNDRFERRGLTWVIALARLELGAMLAAFSPRAESFQRVPPTGYERRAYDELLVDAMRCHLWGLQSDPLFNERELREAAKKNDQVTMLYDRRTRLALKLIDAVRQRTGMRISRDQLEELRQYEQKFGEYLAVLRKHGSRGGDDSAASRKGTSARGNTRP
jgi:hypothetical protein